MKMNRYLFFGLLLSAFLAIRFQCRKDVPFEHLFLEKVNLFPRQTSYHINDTIWMEYVNNNGSFLDRNTGQMIRVDTSSVTASFSYESDPYVGSNTISGSLCDFVLTPATVFHVDSGQTYKRLSISLGCSKGLGFSVGIIPKTKGKYGINFYDNTYVLPCNNVPATRISRINYRFTNDQKDYMIQVE